MDANNKNSISAGSRCPKGSNVGRNGLKSVSLATRLPPVSVFSGFVSFPEKQDVARMSPASGEYKIQSYILRSLVTPEGCIHLLRIAAIFSYLILIGPTGITHP